MMAALWDGTHSIGWLATDNFVQKRPLKGYQAELLTLFARAVAQLITRKQAEIALRTRESLLKGVFDSAADGILLLDISLRIVQANQSAASLLGLNRETANAYKLTDFFTVDFLQFPFGTRQELPCTRPDGTTFPAEAVLTELPGGQQAAYIFLIQDTSERVAIRSALQERELYRLELQKERELSDLKSRFISIVSHEFRTPLATIKTTISNLERYGERMALEQRTERYATISQQVAHMARLMEDVLLFGRLDQGAMQIKSVPIRIGSFVERVVDEFSIAQTEHPITCLISPAAQNLTVHGDDGLLRQILVNLLGNAAKYSLAGSPIAVGLERGAGIEDGYVLIHVIDHGIGIPPQEKERLFEPFQRAGNVGTRQGTGLGLAIVKRAVDLHQGKVRVESVLEQGTTFTVLLPFSTFVPNQRNQRNMTS